MCENFAKAIKKKPLMCLQKWRQSMHWAVRMKKEPMLEDTEDPVNVRSESAEEKSSETALPSGDTLIPLFSYFSQLGFTVVFVLHRRLSAPQVSLGWWSSLRPVTEVQELWNINADVLMFCSLLPCECMHSALRVITIRTDQSTVFHHLWHNMDLI